MRTDFMPKIGSGLQVLSQPLLAVLLLAFGSTSVSAAPVQEICDGWGGWSVAHQQEKISLAPSVTIEGRAIVIRGPIEGERTPEDKNPSPTFVAGTYQKVLNALVSEWAQFVKRKKAIGSLMVQHLNPEFYKRKLSYKLRSLNTESVSHAPGGSKYILSAPLQDIRRMLKDLEINEVRLDSAGGDIRDGHKISALIDYFKLNTRVLDGGLCASACITIFWAGRERIAPHDSLFLFHLTRINNIQFKGRPYVLKVEEREYCSSKGMAANCLSKLDTPEGIRDDEIMDEVVIQYFKRKIEDKVSPWAQISIGNDVCRGANEMKYSIRNNKGPYVTQVDSLAAIDAREKAEVANAKIKDKELVFKKIDDLFIWIAKRERETRKELFDQKEIKKLMEIADRIKDGSVSLEIENNNQYGCDPRKSAHTCLLFAKWPNGNTIYISNNALRYFMIQELGIQAYHITAMLYMVGDPNAHATNAYSEALDFLGKEGRHRPRRN